MKIKYFQDGISDKLLGGALIKKNTSNRFPPFFFATTKFVVLPSHSFFFSFGTLPACFKRKTNPRRRYDLPKMQVDLNPPIVTDGARIHDVFILPH